MDSIKLMAISGSLRKTSYNSAALEALNKLAPNPIHVNIYRGLSDLPMFNPDLEGELIPEYEEMRKLLGSSDGLIVSSPEYAHGISGVLKNALDWLVSGEEFVNIPVMIINTSPRASHALESLREVVRTMSGHIVEEACLSIPLLGSNLDSQGILRDKDLSEKLNSGLYKFYSNIKTIKRAP